MAKRAIMPQGKVQDYKTYQLAAPRSTHWRDATCAEVDCPHYLHGWRVKTDGLPPEMVHAARTSGRKFTELAMSPTDNYLVFEAGQKCFRAATHKLPLDKQELFIVRDGDWRGNPTGNRRMHTRPEHWIEDMEGHLDGVRKRIQAG